MRVPGHTKRQCDRDDARNEERPAIREERQRDTHDRHEADGYIDLLTDSGSFSPLFTDLRSVDALEFEGYAERLARSTRKAGSEDAMLAGHATITDVPIQLGVMKFAFMGGSMGAVVGEKVTRLAERATTGWTQPVVARSVGVTPIEFDARFLDGELGDLDRDPHDSVAVDSSIRFRRVRGLDDQCDHGRRSIRTVEWISAIPTEPSVVVSQS